MVLKGFFDASARPGGVFCVAGFAFKKLQLQKFDRDWWKFFGKYGGCHMKELTFRRHGRFKGVEQQEADRLIAEAVKILRKRASFGVAVSCDLKEIDSLLPKWIQGFEHAYPVCCHMAMHILGSKIAESGSDHEVAYTFETGDLYSGCAHNFMKNALKAPEVVAAYRHKSHVFADKADALALQGADMLAWEWAKYFDETVGKRIRPMRLSLQHLLRDPRTAGYDDKVYKLAHLTGDSLKRWSEQVTELGLSQLAEDTARKNRSSGEAA